MPHPGHNTGFTLTELMVVVAIAFPILQGYNARSQATSGLASITSLRITADEHFARGILSPSLEQLGISNAHANYLGQIAPQFSATDGTGTITFTFGEQANSAIRNATITLERTADGNWTCRSSIASPYKPRNCQG